MNSNVAARPLGNAPLVAMIFGIIACAMNLLIVTAVIGIILGIVAIAMGLASRKKHPFGKAGVILGLLSFVIVAIYAFSAGAIMSIDPFV